MLIDGISLVDGQVIANSHVESGAAFPVSPKLGRTFYLNAALPNNAVGFYVWNGTEWVTGDISAVNAGSGMIGGGSSGAVSLGVDTTVIATRAYAESIAAKVVAGSGISYDQPTGTISLSATTDLVTEGTTNKYFSDARAAAAAPVQSVNGRVGVVSLTKADVGLGLVENKDSATIRSELTSTNVTTALGYTPLNGAGGTVGDLVVSGNLTVSGTTTTINTETVAIADNIIELNSNFTTGTPTENSGFMVKRGSSTAAMFIWDETNDRFQAQDFFGNTMSIKAYSFIGNLEGHALTSTTANKLSTPRSINGVSFDGSENIRFDTSSVGEGSNLYFTAPRARAQFSAAGHGLSYNLSTGEFKSNGTQLNSPGTLVYRDEYGAFSAGRITAVEFIGPSSSANKLTTGRMINGVSFDGSANISFTTDSVAEGLNNLYFTTARARGAISVTGAGTYDAATGVINVVGGVTSVNGKTGAVTLAKADVGLGLVEDKSSATIRSEITSLNVTTALGYSPMQVDQDIDGGSF